MILDLFACAGGATTGIAMLGRKVVGIDHDRDACATHAAAGHPTIRADLTRPVPVVGEFEMVWASPPCTAFSLAGKGEGRELADVLVSRILAEDWSPMDADPAVWLVLPTMAAILDLAPVAVAMENVPPTLPVMRACALVLERHGYRTAVGVLSAECFGVAQTRKRAFLIANRTRLVAMPEPTHQAYGSEVDEAQGSLFGEPLLPWVSMADALGWSEGWGTGQETARGAGMTERHGTRPVRPAAAPSEVISSKTRSWERVPVAMDRRTISRGPGGTRVPTVTVPSSSPSPSMTVSGLARGQFRWTTVRPSTTLVSSFRPDVVASPHSKGSNVSRQDHPGSISITVAEAARLQAFPNGYPFQGSRSSVYKQIGNAVPPPVAAAVAGAALGIDWQPAVAAYLAELYQAPLEERAA